MAGRNDFGILRSDFLTDPRADRAAELYTERLGVPEDLALATVSGHITILGIWAMRDSNAGILPGDGLAVVRDVTRTSRSRARDVMNILLEVGLLRAVEGGVYLVGFRDCYEPILERRAANAEANRLARLKARRALEKKATELGVSLGASPRRKHHDIITSDPTVPFRSVPSVPAVPTDPTPPSVATATANGGGGGSPAAPDGE